MNVDNTDGLFEILKDMSNPKAKETFDFLVSLNDDSFNQCFQGAMVSAYESNDFLWIENLLRLSLYRNSGIKMSDIK